MKLDTLLKIRKYIGFKRIKQFLVYNIPYDNFFKNEYSGTIDVAEYEALVSLAELADKICGGGLVIEIGALFGFSTQAILEGSKGNVVVIDNFSWNPIGLTSIRHEQLFRSNMNFFTRQKRLQIFKMTSDDYLKKVYQAEKISLVFIDADHSYEGVSKDIQVAEALNCIIVSGDDYSFAGVKKAVDENYGSLVQKIGDMWWVDRRDLK